MSTSPKLARSALSRHITVVAICLLVLSLLALGPVAPSPADAQVGTGTRLRVMAVGDSVTHGALERPSWRYGFQKRVRQSGCAIDLVGPNNVLRDVVSAAGIRPGMDHDHSAWGGRTSQMALRETSPWLPLFRPEVVIVHVGVNDITQGRSLTAAVTQVETLIRRARAANPNVAILVTRIAAPGAIYRIQTQQFGNGIGRMARRVHTARSPVVVVDQATGWNLAKLAPLDDPPHPNRAGEEFIAHRYAAAFAKLDRCDSIRRGDHERPSRPGWIRLTRQGRDLRLDWGRSLDASGPVRYMIRRNGFGIGQTTDNTFRVLDANLNATYSVVPVDRLGNTGLSRARRLR